MRWDSRNGKKVRMNDHYRWYEVQMHAEFTMWEATSGTNVQRYCIPQKPNDFFNGIKYINTTITFVVFAFQEHRFCAGRMSGESTGNTYKLLRPRESLKYTKVLKRPDKHCKSSVNILYPLMHLFLVLTIFKYLFHTELKKHHHLQTLGFCSQWKKLQLAFIHRSNVSAVLMGICVCQLKMAATETFHLSGCTNFCYFAAWWHDK